MLLKVIGTLRRKTIASNLRRKRGTRLIEYGGAQQYHVIIYIYIIIINIEGKKIEK